MTVAVILTLMIMSSMLRRRWLKKLALILIPLVLGFLVSLLILMHVAARAAYREWLQSYHEDYVPGRAWWPIFLSLGLGSLTAKAKRLMLWFGVDFTQSRVR